jgi:hypothetical protein
MLGTLNLIKWYNLISSQKLLDKTCGGGKTSRKKAGFSLFIGSKYPYNYFSVIFLISYIS